MVANGIVTEASNAPVTRATIVPEYRGKALATWKAWTKRKEPPRDKKMLPAMYPSDSGMANAVAIKMAPMARQTLPTRAANRGPYLSSKVPTGSADTLLVVEAIAKNRFSLAHRSAQIIHAF